MIDDKSLIARIVYADDQHAFTTLVRKYQDPIRQFLRRLTAGERAMADDIAQETFIRIYQKLESFDGRSSFTTWAHKIAYHCFLRFKQKAHFKHEINDLEQPNLASTNSAVENDILVQQLMKSLGIEERTCITLSVSVGMSHQQISEVTSFPLGTVKSHITRGKQKLMDKVNNQD